MNIRKHILILLVAWNTNIYAQSYFYSVGYKNPIHIATDEEQKEIPYETSDLIESSDTVSKMPENMDFSKYVSYPLDRITVTSPFGNRRDPLNRRTTRMHSGIDLRAHFDKVYAMLPGIVQKTGYSKAGGFFVTLVHGNCICTYLHLSQVRVHEGNHVSAGDVVAVSGSSGLRCTGPHLHISCRWDDIEGKYFNPLLLLKFITMKLGNN